ncbi:MAG: NifB/NifX family molybdenum-iron cluster-binding protein [Syntrophobacteraceae bacterium]
MLAVPVFRSRVAPVFNWCSKILLFPENSPDNSSCEEVALSDTADPFERLRVLHRKGVTTLICGALSPDLLNYAEDLKIEIICGVAGGVSDVLDAYKEHKLDQPHFLLPGCRCIRRAGGTERRCAMPGNPEKGNVRRGTEHAGGRKAGPDDESICPKCGTAAHFGKYTPCAQLRCPGCGRRLAPRQ